MHCQISSWQIFVRVQNSEIQQNNKVACKTKSFCRSVNLLALIMALQVMTIMAQIERQDTRVQFKDSLRFGLFLGTCDGCQLQRKATELQAQKGKS